jgi:hypothetical protein
LILPANSSNSTTIVATRSQNFSTFNLNMANFLSTPHSQASYGGSIGWFGYAHQPGRRSLSEVEGQRARSTLERVCVLYPLRVKISYTPLFKVLQKNFIYLKPLKNGVSYEQS